MKNWPYWVKGGIVGAILLIIIGLPAYVSPALMYKIPSFLVTGTALLYFAFYLALPNMIGLVNLSWFGVLFTKCGEYRICPPSFLGVIFYLGLYFIVGVIIGWIYGKIKNRNRV